MSTPLSGESVTILVIEDNPGDIRIVREVLKGEDPYHYILIVVDRIDLAIKCLTETKVDVILLDFSLPDGTGIEAFERIQAAAFNVPIVVLTGTNDETLALQAVRAGAQDYLLKRNLDSHILARVLRYAIERKRADVVLRNALDKERELNELKSRFVSMVSHDFRTPLAIIQSSSDLLNKYSDRMTVEKKEGHFTTIGTQIKRLTDLLEDLLTLTKAEIVGLNFSPVLCDLRIYCQEIVDDMQQLAGRRQITFVVEGEVTSVAIDYQLMRRALVNLLSNAAKYSPPEGVIEFRLSGGSEQVLFCIQDQGIGIPQEDQARMFEVFHRANNVGNIPGTGLGLAIVKLAVDAHGGTITLDTHANVGTAFTISIPVTR